MKSTKILLIFLTVLTLASCKKDDGGEDEFVLNNANLSGNYELVFLRSVTVETTEVNGLQVVSTITSVGDTFQVDYFFARNGTYEATGLFRVLTTTVVNGEQTMEDAVIEDIDIQGNYTITASTSIIVIDGVTYEVSLFNENQFRITRSAINTFPNGDTVEFSEELRFVRL